MNKNSAELFSKPTLFGGTTGVLIIKAVTQGGGSSGPERRTHPPTSKFLDFSASAKRAYPTCGTQDPGQKIHFFLVIDADFDDFHAPARIHVHCTHPPPCVMSTS